ncbi:MAG: Trehalose/maltose import ATP-binding protein MalK [Methanobacterium sp. PtaU1.Bin097]|nr:MAG: Trehalose/maltose import ATP-binding protein MalK [Methanobacterium sp. PtaU1.Bin097]
MNHYRDLAFVIILDILSIIWLITPSLNSYPFNIVPYLLLIFILPGYSLLAVLKPTLNQMRVKGRSIFSVNLSLLITLLIIIALNEPPLASLFNALAALTFFLTIVGFMRRRTGFEEPDLQVYDEEPISGTREVYTGADVPAGLNDKDIAIKVENVSMQFNLSQEKVDNLKEYVIKLAKGELFYQEFWALKNISFYVKRGEKMGIVGLNGAGKSTLLKLISGVMKPTTGNITVNGGIVPLLELGGGFDGNYTGRENIFLRGALLGYSKEFMESKYDEIVEFSELEEFIDVPVKNYSSGMITRLGFSISTIVHPQILILDEVLSVGDAKFQEKSMQRMKSFLNQDVTVLLVSHSAAQIKNLCSRAIWLDKGRMVMMGDAEEVADKYMESVTRGA